MTDSQAHKVLSKATNSHWIIAGILEEKMLSSKLAALEKKDLRGGMAMGDIFLSEYGIRFCPGICTLQEFCRGTCSSIDMELMWDQIESPGCFGPHPAALVSGAWTHVGFTQT